jgi:DNA-binding MarR family transcriptional regulator
MTVDEYVEKFMKYRPNRLLNDSVQGQTYVVCYLSDGDKTVTELANLINVSTARMAVIVNSLEKQGKVERLNDPTDKRITKVHLTSKGNETIDCVREFLKEKVEKAIKILGEEEFDRFVMDLYKLINSRGM